MKLYFSPGACSLSPHIIAREAGIPLELVKVSGPDKKTSDGSDFRALNPKGYVPALVLDDGSLLTEGAVIVQYLADQKPDAKLVPKAGTLERYRAQEWLNFIASEVHKGFSPLFNKANSDDVKQASRDRLATRYELLEKALTGKKFLLGDAFSVADAYLFTVTRWSAVTGVDLSKYPAVTEYVKRIGERPAVKAAIDAETSK